MSDDFWGKPYKFPETFKSRRDARRERNSQKGFVMTEDDIQFLKEIEELEVEEASVEQINRYRAICDKWLSPTERSSEIDALLRQANELIEQALELAAETNTPVRFTPHEWGEEFSRVFMTKQTEKQFRMISRVWDLFDGTGLNDFCVESSFSEEGNWQHWSSSSLTC
jgi:hypothetical protein